VSSLTFVKLADRMSKRADQATKDRLYHAVLHEAYRSKKQSCSPRLSMPLSLSFEGQSYFLVRKEISLCLGITRSQLEDYDTISDIGQRWMTQSPSQDGRMSEKKHWPTVTLEDVSHLVFHFQRTGSLSPRTCTPLPIKQ
jgi:hypothetical protein